jgi:hypothetical protein
MEDLVTQEFILERQIRRTLLSPPPTAATEEDDEPHYFLPRIIDDDGHDAFFGPPAEVIKDARQQLAEIYMKIIHQNRCAYHCQRISLFQQLNYERFQVNSEFNKKKRALQEWYLQVTKTIPDVMLSTPPTPEQLSSHTFMNVRRHQIKELYAIGMEALRADEIKKLGPIYLYIEELKKPMF